MESVGECWRAVKAVVAWWMEKCVISFVCACGDKMVRSWHRAIDGEGRNLGVEMLLLMTRAMLL